MRFAVKRFFNRIIPGSFYNVTIGVRPRFVWYRVAKVGTRTILAHLEFHAELKVRSGVAISAKMIPGDVFSFAFVRNPWDRLVSCYSNKVLSKKSFEECWDKDFDFFVRWVCAHDLRSADSHFRLQSYLVPNNVDFVGRFENFQEDTNFVMDKLGLPPLAEHKNKSARKKDYRDYYTEELRELVAEHYKMDIERFGYSFE